MCVIALLPQSPLVLAIGSDEKRVNGGSMSVDGLRFDCKLLCLWRSTIMFNQILCNQQSDLMMRRTMLLVFYVAFWVCWYIGAGPGAMTAAIAHNMSAIISNFGYDGSVSHSVALPSYPLPYLTEHHYYCSIGANHHQQWKTWRQSLFNFRMVMVQGADGRLWRNIILSCLAFQCLGI